MATGGVKCMSISAQPEAYVVMIGVCGEEK